MATTNSQFDMILGELLVYSNEERLAVLKDVYMQVLVDARENHGTIRLIIRQREHHVADPAEFLRFLRDEIKRLEDQIARQKYGPSRNYAFLGKAQ